MASLLPILTEDFMKKTISLTLALFAIFGFITAGCDDGNTVPDPISEAKVITITFNTAGGSRVAAVEINEGRSLPAAYFGMGDKVPGKTDFIFTGWIDEAGTAIDPKSKFNTDTTLTAQWAEPQNITIEFDTVGGSSVDSINIKQGQSLSSDYFGDGSKAPQKTGYRLKGWKDGTMSIHNAYPLMNSTTLTAQWVRLITVHFYMGDDGTGNEILIYGAKPQDIIIDNNAPLGDKYPKNPDRGNDWAFAGWYNGVTKYTNIEPRISVNDTDPAIFTLTAWWLMEVVPENAQSPAIHPGSHFQEISGEAGIDRIVKKNEAFSANGLFSNVSDGGTLSAKWYRYTGDPDESFDTNASAAETAHINGTGEEIDLQTQSGPSPISMPFTWKESEPGEYWYWVVVTNTNNKATENKTATATTNDMLHVTVTE